LIDPARVRFVLVQPQSAGNVGAAARACKNLGFHRLALVRPRCDPRDAQARKMAVDAAGLLDLLEIHDSLDLALEGASTVVGTSRRRGKHRLPHYRLDLFARQLARFAVDGELALVFGREDHGLHDRELDLCTHLVHLPSDAGYPSFNLAQAILLVAYELRLALQGDAPEAAGEPVADHGSREAMYRHLQEALETIGYLHEDSVEPIMRRLRRLLGRAALTEREVAMLRGLARQILWAARPAERPAAADDAE
jgi:tRNA/rRNA methyltransferase